MPFYAKLGSFPDKRHVTFEKPEGGYYYEQLFGTEGFHGFSSLLYHVHRPTQVKSVSKPIDLTPKAAIDKNKIFIKYAVGAGKTRLDQKYIEKKLNVVATIRNWNTVTTLLEMFG